MSVSDACVTVHKSPWYDLRGWLGVKQQLSIYLQCTTVGIMMQSYSQTCCVSALCECLSVYQWLTYMSHCRTQCRHNDGVLFSDYDETCCTWVSSMSVNQSVTHVSQCTTVGIIMKSYSQTMTRRAVRMSVSVSVPVTYVSQCSTVGIIMQSYSQTCCVSALCHCTWISQWRKWHSAEP